MFKIIRKNEYEKLITDAKNMRSIIITLEDKVREDAKKIINYDLLHQKLKDARDRISRLEDMLSSAYAMSAKFEELYTKCHEELEQLKDKNKTHVENYVGKLVIKALGGVIDDTVMRDI